MLVRSGTQALDVALQRLAYEQRDRALMSLVHYCDEIVRIYAPPLSRLPTGTRIVHELASWPLDVPSNYTGKIAIEIQTTTILVTTALITEGMAREQVKTYVRV